MVREVAAWSSMAALYHLEKFPLFTLVGKGNLGGQLAILSVVGLFVGAPTLTSHYRDCQGICRAQTHSL